MKKTAKGLLVSVFIFVLITLMPMASAQPISNSGGDCPIETLNKDYAQLMLSVFGKAGVRPLLDSGAEIELLNKMTTEDVSICTDGFSSFGESSTKIGLISMYLLASPLIIIVALMLFFNKSSHGMIKGSSSKAKLAFTLVSVSILIAMLFPVKKMVVSDDTDTELDDAYAPIHKLLFEGIALGLKQAEQVSVALSPVFNLALPLYAAPKPYYLALNDQGVDGSGYQLNKMSAILDYAECLVTELPKAKQEDTLIPKMANTEDLLVAKFGKPNASCYLEVSIPKNKETVKHMTELELEGLSVSDYENNEKVFFEVTVQEMVAEAHNYKEELMRSSADIGVPLDDRYQSFELTGKEAQMVPSGGGNLTLVDLLKLDRQAEVALSRIFTSRFYSPEFEIDGTQRVVDVASRCEGGIEACVVDVCSFDPTGQQLGLMDCAVVVKTLHSFERIKQNEERGFITRLLNLWQLSSKVELPRDVQSQLANMIVDVRSDRSNSNEFDIERRKWIDKYDEALFETNLAYDGVAELIPKASNTSSFDLFGVDRLATCLDNPNQEVYRTSANGEEYMFAKCGTVLQTIDEFGENMIKYALLLKGGAMTSPMLNKVYKKLIGGKLKKASPEGAEDGGLSDKSNDKQSKLKVGLAALGALSSGGFLVAMLGSTQVQPFDNVVEGLDLLTATAAFSVGAVMGSEGVLKAVPYLLLCLGFFFKYGFELLLIGFCLYLLLFVWFKTLVVSVPTTLYRALSVLADDNGMSQRITVLAGQMCVLVLFPPFLLFVTYSILPLMDYVASGVLSALQDWIMSAMSGGTQSSKVVQVVLWVCLIGVAMLFLPLVSLALVHKVYGMLSDVCGDTSSAMLAAKQQDAAIIALDAKGAMDSARR